MSTAEPAEAPRGRRDCHHGTLTDAVTGLVWLKKAGFFDTAWTSADVGVPSAPAVFDQFITLQYYWTSSTDAGDPRAAWTVFSCDYGVHDTPKAATGYTLAVRD